MIKYDYNYDAIDDVVSRTTAMVYPYIATLNAAIANGAYGDKIMTLATKIYQGVAEDPLLTIENNWFDKQSAIQDAHAEMKKVDDLVLQLADATIDEMAKDAAIADLTSILGNYDAKTLDADVTTYKTDKQKVIDDLVVERDNIENGYTDIDGTVVPASEWLKSYRGVTTTVTRPVVTGVIPVDVRKKIMSHEINRTVRNMEDTVADLAKSNTLLMSFIASIYNTLSATQKSKIPAAEKAIIDYAVGKWSATSTRGDRQLQTEGTALVDKLYSREVDIANIVDAYMK